METIYRQLEGQAFYGIGDEPEVTNNFIFSPDDPVPGMVPAFRKRGVAVQTSNGEFEFVPTPCKRTQAKLIKKYAHGRLSFTKDNAFLLTLKFYADEPCKLSAAMKEEVKDAYKRVKSMEKGLK